MGFKVDILHPSELLKPYIEYYKYIEGSITGTFKNIPSTNQELYFHFKNENFHFYSPDKYYITCPLIFLIGLHNYEQDFFSSLPKNESIRSFVVVFKANGFQRLFKLTNPEINTYALDGHSIFGNYTEFIWEKLKPCSSITGMKNKFEAILLKLISINPLPATFITDVLEIIKVKNGIITGGQLSKLFNTSIRTLQRKFRDEVGMSPKEYLQITRLNYTLTFLSSKDENSLTEISYISGYYDQSHFIRDIKRISGSAPGNLETLEKCDNRGFLRVS